MPLQTGGVGLSRVAGLSVAGPGAIGFPLRCFVICKLTQRLTLVGLFALMTLSPSAARAQFEGLDLTDSAPAPKKAPAKKAEPKKAPEAAPAPAEKSLELDLSSTADVKAVLILPPIVKVTSSTGGFSGFDTKKVSEKFDLAAHKRLVASFEKQLDGKVIPAELTANVLTKEGLTPATVRTPAGVQKLARATNVAFMVVTEINKTGALVGNIFDATGKQQGQPSFVNNATGITQKHADDMAAYVAKELVTASKAAAAAAAALAAANAPKDVAPPLPPPEDDVTEPVTEFATVNKKSFFDADPFKPRLVVSVGPGAVFRNAAVTGDRAASLAEVRSGGVVGLGVYAQLNPLQFIDATAGKRWSDLELEVNWRRAFVSAKGTEGSVEGQTCSMTDDDLQLRGTYRYRLGDEGTYLPSIGVGGGFSQENTLFACNFPVVSMTYRGVDAQLRVKQPLYKEMLALDFAFGPRFLFGGPSAQPGFSIGGEAWVEVKPISYLFGRAGGRISRLQVSDGAALSVVDTRMFFALEVGAFF